ncbi:hypothetical protein DACRYDRAFT_106679 [Dacryopinax primogenitus]|uniref:Uncharacterized protein n=1 Tax=Dacryopinax primogenitus (strain DJM 731) TaxID=1858805 RepID=M5G9R3_DACPD|nr:uncharacterized protein DACRYDRAFT_106679 [Dacryopinax primogenitus]EJU02612.1 hypothetical protein DACRYDRAFT_106679 [Dacryopinax primogenitus]
MAFAVSQKFTRRSQTAFSFSKGIERNTTRLATYNTLATIQGYEYDLELLSARIHTSDEEVNSATVFSDSEVEMSEVDSSVQSVEQESMEEIDHNSAEESELCAIQEEPVEDSGEEHAHRVDIEHPDHSADCGCSSDEDEKDRICYIQREMSLDEALRLANSTPIFRPAKCHLSWSCACARCKQQRAQKLIQHVTGKLAGTACRLNQGARPDAELKQEQDKRKQQACRETREPLLRRHSLQKEQYSKVQSTGKLATMNRLDRFFLGPTQQVSQSKTSTRKHLHKDIPRRADTHRRQFSMDELEVIELLTDLATVHRKAQPS